MRWLLNFGCICAVALAASFVSSMGTAHASASAFSIKPNSQDFGTLKAGSGTNILDFTVTDVGNVDLHFQGTSLTGSNATDWFMSIDQCSYRTLTPGASCLEAVGFAPQKTGSLTAGLTFVDDAIDSPQTAVLTGTGTGPVVTFVPATLAFPSEPVGTQSSPQTIYVKNTGDSPLTISSATPTPGGVGKLVVVSDRCSGTTVPAGTTCPIQLALIATQALAGGVMLNLQTNAGRGTQLYNISANLGLAPLAQIYNPTFFAKQAQNSASTPQYVQLTNDGTTALHVQSASLGGANPDQFKIASDACSGGALDPGSTCQVGVELAPTTVGQASASLTFVDDSPSPQQSTTLVGTGIAPGAVVSPTNVDFGVISDQGGSASQAITITNPTSQPLHVSSAWFTSGLFYSAFAVASNPCRAAAINPGGSCQLTVSFTPPFEHADYEGVLTITDDGGQQTVNFYGGGYDPPLFYSPHQFNFGNQRVGAQSPAQTFTLTNNSTSAVNVPTFDLQGTNPADFNFRATSCGQSIASGASCAVSITFRPTGMGPRSAYLHYLNPITQYPDFIQMFGTGIAPLQPSYPPGASFDFGTQQVGGSSFVWEAGVHNNGTDFMHVTALTLSGANAGAFVLGSNDCIGVPVAPNTTCVVAVTFKPLAAGSESATLTFSDDALNGPFQLILNGTGVTSHATVTPTSIAFPATAVGAEVSQSISVVSDGAAPLNVASVPVTGSGAGAFKVTGDTCSNGQFPATIGCSIRVSFAPTAIGPVSATVAIGDDAPGSPQVVAVSGTGLDGHLTPSPASVNFGSLGVGSKSPKVIITATNDGNASLAIGHVSISGTAASIFNVVADSCTGTKLGPGAACTVAVYFAPEAIGAQSAQLVFPNDGLGGSQSVPLSGIGS